MPTARPRGRPARHTTATITQAACRLADREGLDAVTMRRVADELGAGAASLYTYVATRDDLFDLMRDAVAAEYVLGPPTGDRLSDVVAVALQTREILLRHPWNTALVESRPGTGPHTLDVLEHVLAALDAAPADDETKLATYGAVNAVVVAYVRSEIADHRVVEQTVAGLAAAAADGRHPHIAGLRLGGTGTGSGEQALRRILTGMLTGLLGDTA